MERRGHFVEILPGLERYLHTSRPRHGMHYTIHDHVHNDFNGLLDNSFQELEGLHDCLRICLTLCEERISIQ
jgi:hypothetical protein